MTPEQWVICAERGIVIVAFKAYSQYDETGGLADKHYIGIRFGCLTSCDTDGAVVDEDLFVYIDEAIGKFTPVAETPEQALELCLAQLDNV